MDRTLKKELCQWKEKKERIPLLIRGARQVGKSYLIETFGRESFELFATVNFELRPEYGACFQTLDPTDILPQLEGICKTRIIPGETLLFFDEIQNCPRALMALRYFKEKMPQLHVVSAGSLLEFTIEDENFSFPVGRVQFLYLKPLSFREFLKAKGEEKLIELLEHTTVLNPLGNGIHEHLLNLVKLYFFTGGMPAAVQSFLKENSFLECQRIHETILGNYQSDFGKYASKAQHKYLQRLFEKAPHIVGHHFKFSKIDPEMRSRDLKIALEQLGFAGLIQQVHASSASGIPLKTQVKENKFKLLFLDIGLLQTSLQIDPQEMLKENLLQINAGILAEQFVGQELSAFADPYRREDLFFWEREQYSSSAQVDYIISLGSHIIPIEVKAGKAGKLKSLHLFMKEKQSPLGIHISQAPLAFKDRLLSLPLYMIDQIPRLSQNLLS